MTEFIILKAKFKKEDWERYCDEGIMEKLSQESIDWDWREVK
jgi:hypothetical protein